MKNKILTGVLATSLLISTSGLAIYYDFANDLEKVVITKQDDVNKKSTKIANLEAVIVKKDNDLNVQNMVIEEQIVQINKQKQQIQKQNNQIKELQKQANFKKMEERSDANPYNQRLVSRGESKKHKTINVVATGYIALCDTGCTGITRTGLDVKNTPSKKIIAVDPSVIPLHSRVKVDTGEDIFFAVAEDTGGDIDGKRIDILFATHNEAIEFGRQDVTITILKEGE